MSQRETSPMGVGVISILTVLLVLTLAIFSALSLASARADLALSQINADTVAAYYAADAAAARIYAAFSAGQEPELEATLPISARSSLRLHLDRDGDGGVRVLAWQTVPTPEPEREEAYLPVFTGTPPGDAPPG